MREALNEPEAFTFDISGAEAKILAAALFSTPLELSHPRPVLSRLNAKLQKVYGVKIKYSKEAGCYCVEREDQLHKYVAFLCNPVYPRGK